MVIGWQEKQMRFFQDLEYIQELDYPNFSRKLRKDHFTRHADYKGEEKDMNFYCLCVLSMFCLDFIKKPAYKELIYLHF